MKNSKDKLRNHRSRWTLQEQRYLEEHYGHTPTSDIAEVLGRSVVSVRQAANSLNCRKIKVIAPWTEEELQILRTWYPTEEGLEHVSQRLPNRNTKAIAAQARKLGLQSGYYRKRHWRDAEIAIVKRDYPSLGVEVASRLPGRSKNAIKALASKLGIRYIGGTEHGACQRTWTEEEWQRLKIYFHLPPSELPGYFPGRTLTSIAKAKRRLKKWEDKK